MIVWPTVPVADLGSPNSLTWTATTHPSIKESTKGGGRLRRPPPFVEVARSAASFMDGCVGAGEAADAAETHVNVSNKCTCMHTLRATSDPHGHYGRPIQSKIRICPNMVRMVRIWFVWPEYGPNMVRICPNMSEYGPNMVRIWSV